jgi:hypothetical protein
VDRNRLLAEHPVVYHMAEDGSWPNIAARGLLSTSALVDLFNPPSEIREAVLGQVRRTSTILTHPEHGTAVIRDQAPLKFIDRCLTEGSTRQQFLDALNGRVFFWVTRARLDRLLGARLYRAKPHVVLHVDTARLLEDHGEDVQLTPYNTGSVHVPNMPKRGPEVFVDIRDYPYDEWRRKRGAAGEALVELTVPYSVPDIAQYTIRVERWVDGTLQEVLDSTG